MKKLLALLILLSIPFSLHANIFYEPEGKICINSEMDKAIAFGIANNYSIADHKDGVRHRLTEFFNHEHMSLFQAEEELIYDSWSEITGTTHYSYMYINRTRKLEYRIYDLYSEDEEKIIYTCGKIDINCIKIEKDGVSMCLGIEE